MALQDNELDVIAKFLGHDIQTHRDYYRLPDPSVEVAKISKFLLALEGNGQHPVEALRGKSLDEIQLHEDEGMITFVLYY